MGKTARIRSQLRKVTINMASRQKSAASSSSAVAATSPGSPAAQISARIRCVNDSSSKNFVSAKSSFTRHAVAHAVASSSMLCSASDGGGNGESRPSSPEIIAENDRSKEEPWFRFAAAISRTRIVCISDRCVKSDPLTNISSGTKPTLVMRSTVSRILHHP